MYDHSFRLDQDPQHVVVIGETGPAVIPVSEIHGDDVVVSTPSKDMALLLEIAQAWRYFLANALISDICYWLRNKTPVGVENIEHQLSVTIDSSVIA